MMQFFTTISHPLKSAPSTLREIRVEILQPTIPSLARVINSNQKLTGRNISRGFSASADSITRNFVDKIGQKYVT